jgi:hypothetical protein
LFGQGVGVNRSAVVVDSRGAQHREVALAQAKVRMQKEDGISIRDGLKIDGRMKVDA